MKLTGNIGLLEFLIVIAVVLPSILIGFKSMSGSNTGFFVLYLWLAGGCIYGFLGVVYFIFGLLLFSLVAFIFREKLALSKWWSRK